MNKADAPALEGKVCVLDVATGEYASGSFGGSRVDLSACNATAVGVFDPGQLKVRGRVTIEVPAAPVIAALEGRFRAAVRDAEEELHWIEQIKTEVDDA